MSGIVVVFHRDGRPADTTALARMMDSIAYRGPDGRGIAAGGSVALGFLRLCTTPEAFVEPMPLGAEGAPTVLFDGRLDEREVLTAAVTAAGEAPVGPGDGELVLRAYRVWGERFAERLLGDFVAVVWDSAAANAGVRARSDGQKTPVLLRQRAPVRLRIRGARHSRAPGGAS